MPVDRGDLDRIEDSMRSEIGVLRGRIDGVVDAQSDERERIKGLEVRVDSMEKKVADHDKKIDRWFWLTIPTLVTIIIIFLVAILKLVGGI